MTTLYRPVRIETAEQAEALPVATVALVRDDTEDAVAVKTWSDVWQIVGRWPEYTNADAIGWQALVPIEAEEETDLGAAFDFGAGPVVLGPVTRRFVTPWEGR